VLNECFLKYDLYLINIFFPLQRTGMFPSERLKGETDHNVLPDVGRSLPDQAFDTTQDSKKIQVHPTDPNKTTSIAVNLDPA
jgi:hypothetical protein